MSQKNLNPSLLTAALAAAFSTAAIALPSGMHVVNGSASAGIDGGRLTVRNSAGAILHWQSFSIGAGEATRFIQPNAASSVLNRVVGGDPSSILGSLSSNGRVFLINPQGIVFGNSARIDVAGLVASTLDIADADFLSGRMRFEGTGGAVENHGEIRTAAGGQVLLFGTEVANHGLIEAPGGDIVLAAGSRVELADAANPELRVELQADEHAALNVGSLVANSGRVGIFAGVIRNGGRVSADAAMVGDGGKIVFNASRGVEASASSRISANGATGGTVHIDAGAGSALLQGSIQARGTAAQGGEIDLTGAQVALIGSARVDASGYGGGGDVRVGSHGQTDAVWLSPESAILADATGNGHGGSILLWGTGATRAYGLLSAQGGASGGDGGFVDTSGGFLEIGGRIELGAPHGQGGHWLIDPFNIDVVSSGAINNAGGAPNFTASASPAQIGVDLIAAQLNGGISVTVSTAGAGSDAGDLNWLAPLDVSPNAAVSLTLNAARNVNIRDDIIDHTANGGALALVLNADSDANASGAVSISAADGVTVDVHGNINVTGARFEVGQLANDSRTVVRTSQALTANVTGLISIVANTANVGSGEVNNTTIVEAGGNLSLTGGSIVVRSGLAGAFGDGSSDPSIARAEVLLSAGQNLQLNANNVDLVNSGARSLAGDDGDEYSADSHLRLESGTALSINVTGGDLNINVNDVRATASNAGTKSAEAHGSVVLSAGTSLTIAASTIRMESSEGSTGSVVAMAVFRLNGASGGVFNADNTASASVQQRFVAGGAVNITAGGVFVVRGPTATAIASDLLGSLGAVNDASVDVNNRADAVSSFEIRGNSVSIVANLASGIAVHLSLSSTEARATQFITNGGGNVLDGLNQARATASVNIEATGGDLALRAPNGQIRIAGNSASAFVERWVFGAGSSNHLRGVQSALTSNDVSFRAERDLLIEASSLIRIGGIPGGAEIDETISQDRAVFGGSHEAINTSVMRLTAGRDIRVNSVDNGVSLGTNSAYAGYFADVNDVEVGQSEISGERTAKSLTDIVVTAGSDIVINAGGTNLSIEVSSADASISGSFAANGFSMIGNREATARSRTLVTAGGGISLSAPNSFLLSASSVSARVYYDINGDSNTLAGTDTVDTQTLLSISAAGDIALHQTGAANALVLFAGSANASNSLFVFGDNNVISSARSADAMSELRVHAGGNLSLRGRDIYMDVSSASASLSIDITGNDNSVTGNTAARTTQRIEVSAGGDIEMIATRSIGLSVSSAEASNSVDIVGDGNVVSGARLLDSTSELRVEAGGDLTLRASDIRLSVSSAEASMSTEIIGADNTLSGNAASRVVTRLDVHAGGDIEMSADNSVRISASSPSASNDLSVIGNRNAVGGARLVTADARVRLTADGDINLSAGNSLLSSAHPLLLRSSSLWTLVLAM